MIRSLQHRRWIIVVLGFLSATNPLSTDMYLPAFQEIAHDLHTTTAALSFTLSSYFIGIGVGQMLYGPIIDRFGRKKPLYLGLALYIFASLGCIFSRNGSKTSLGVIYFQLGADEIFAAAGFYLPPPDDLRLLRAAIAGDPEDWAEVRAGLTRKGLTLITEGALQRLPKGFERAPPAVQDDLKLKSWAVYRAERRSQRRTGRRDRDAGLGQRGPAGVWLERVGGRLTTFGAHPTKARNLNNCYAEQLRTMERNRLAAPRMTFGDTASPKSDIGSKRDQLPHTGQLVVPVSCKTRLFAVAINQL